MYNQLPVANGGTGLSTATGALIGAGTTISAVAAGTANNVLTSNGTTWVSAAAQGGPAPVVTIYTSPATWTKSPTVKFVKVTVVGGGGGGAAFLSSPAGPGRWAAGAGGAGIGFFPSPSIPGPATVTVGIAGTGGGSASSGNPGGSSSFGSLITATGGGGVVYASPSAGQTFGAGGSVTPSPQIYGVQGQPGGMNMVLGYIPASPAPTTIAIYAGGNTGFGFGFGGNSNDGFVTGPNSAMPAIGYGSGGSYGSPTGRSGTGGIVIVEEFY